MNLLTMPLFDIFKSPICAILMKMMAKARFTP